MRKPLYNLETFAPKKTKSCINQSELDQASYTNQRSKAADSQQPTRHTRQGGGRYVLTIYQGGCPRILGHSSTHRRATQPPMLGSSAKHIGERSLHARGRTRQQRSPLTRYYYRLQVLLLCHKKTHEVCAWPAKIKPLQRKAVPPQKPGPKGPPAGTKSRRRTATSNQTSSGT